MQAASFMLDQGPLFSDVTLVVSEGDRVGLVGRNGEGKSTFLKTISGETQLTSGSVRRAVPTFYLPQLDRALLKSEATIGDLIERYDMTWNSVRASFAKLFPHTVLLPDREVGTLSGGELVKLLVSIVDSANPGLLLLDEPTNHMDFEGMSALEKFIADFKGAVITVSHDPHFLDRVTTETWRIENGTLRIYGGNYSYFVEQRKLEEESRLRQLESAKKEVKRVRHSMEMRETRESRAARAGRVAKNDASRSKLMEDYFKNRSERGSGKAKIRQDQAMREKQEAVRTLKGSVRKTTFIDLKRSGSKKGKSLVSIEKGSVMVGDKVLLSNIDLRVNIGDRIALVGRNGSGKSMLLKALFGSEEGVHLAGDVRTDNSARWAYVDQKYDLVDPELSVVENMQRANPYLSEEEVYKQLGRFLFVDKTDLLKRGSYLSGGETARLTLAMLTAQDLDVIMLDEPTNNLDIATLEILANALAGFSGALVVVSHNIHFLSSIGITQVLLLKDGAVREIPYMPDEEDFNEKVRSAS